MLTTGIVFVAVLAFMTLALGAVTVWDTVKQGRHIDAETVVMWVSALTLLAFTVWATTILL